MLYTYGCIQLLFTYLFKSPMFIFCFPFLQKEEIRKLETIQTGKRWTYYIQGAPKQTETLQIGKRTRKKAAGQWPANNWWYVGSEIQSEVFA